MKRHLIRSFIKNQKGLSLVEILIATSIVAVTTLTAVTFNNLFFTRATDEINQQSLLQIRNEINQILLDDEAFKKTVDNNPALSCIKNKNSECRGQGGQLALYDRHGNLYQFVASPGQASSGFSSRNGVCNNFSASPGSLACPFQYTLTWQPICPASGKCSNPSMILSAILNYQPGNVSSSISKMFKPSSFNISINRRQNTDSLSVMCEHTGGVYSSLEKRCILPSRNSSCPLGSYLKGFNQNGEIICVTSVSAGRRCPLLQVVIGIDNNGQIVCGPGCSLGPIAPPDGGGGG